VKDDFAHPLQNPQEAFIATNICFLTNFTQLEITKIQANYWLGQMHCGPPNQNFGWAMAHAGAPPPSCRAQLRRSASSSARTRVRTGRPEHGPEYAQLVLNALTHAH